MLMMIAADEVAVLDLESRNGGILVRKLNFDAVINCRTYSESEKQPQSASSRQRGYALSALSL